MPSLVLSEAESTYEKVKNIFSCFGEKQTQFLVTEEISPAYVAEVWHSRQSAEKSSHGSKISSLVA